MESATHQGDLQRLAQQLQTPLLALPNARDLQIQCVIRQDKLMVLGQHPPDETPEPSVVFGILEQTLQSLLPELAQEFRLGQDEAPVHGKLYLRVLGQQQPYAARSFQLSTPIVEPFPSTEALFEPLVEPAIAEQSLDRDLGSHAADDSADQRFSDLTPFSPELEQSSDQAPLPRRSPLLPWLLAGVGVSLICFGTGLWVMSRPCMVGACEPLQTAQTLSQQSTQAIQTAQTGQDLQRAQQQLTDAKRQLEAIPAWSSHHQEAQALQQTYQTQLQTLDLVLAAESNAATATQKSQTLPQSAASLQATQALWREAIAQLQTVSQTNALYAFAQQRLSAYESNLAAIGKLTTAEQQAQKKLVTAKETAKVAEVRQGIARTPENWQLAQTTWQVVINTLKQIPASATSYAEAQQLLSDYQPKLTAARDRATQEQISQKAFTQALALAQKAEIAQRNNQWSQAVANWREALTNVKQVPKNTAYSEPAQPLVASYSLSLKQAEAQLQVAAVMQRTQDDLNRLCAGTPKMCSYTIANNLIRVQFTASYERKLRMAFIVGQSGDRGTLGGAVNHIETLQTALQTISDNAGVPLEVYNADGSDLIGSFNPKG
ncbi:hypothetical protein [Stenomitos frigidus]|uniref:Uncharacterized protein n=1 Tax=Stenomitos frigidus ULC18 TaxID=2107698 RepID=A0A2T1EHR9_9CYAN|nr:hypothetical protein [Stenomitos frigidus]PSB32310.1 hypothetical protein C7B82_05720 [Stenomitos frigidus ULC18]